MKNEFFLYFIRKMEIIPCFNPMRNVRILRYATLRLMCLLSSIHNTANITTELSMKKSSMVRGDYL
ncbi:MAG: hypothetical protein ACMUEM_07510 [Flavobacteriales bacterium AspAUS03]